MTTAETDLYKSTENLFFAHPLLKSTPEVDTPWLKHWARTRRHLAFVIDKNAQDWTTPSPLQNRGWSTAGLPEMHYSSLPETGEDIQYASFEVPGEVPHQTHLMSGIHSPDDFYCQFCDHQSRNRSEYKSVAALPPIQNLKLTSPANTNFATKSPSCANNPTVPAQPAAQASPRKTT